MCIRDRMNPIHLSVIYSALVNGGDMVKPYLLDSESTSCWKEGVFTKEAADTVLADLYQVVEDSDGTAHSAPVSYTHLVPGPFSPGWSRCSRA